MNGGFRCAERGLPGVGRAAGFRSGYLARPRTANRVRRGALVLAEYSQRRGTRRPGSFSPRAAPEYRLAAPPHLPPPPSSAPRKTGGRGQGDTEGACARGWPAAPNENARRRPRLLPWGSIRRPRACERSERKPAAGSNPRQPFSPRSGKHLPRPCPRRALGRRSPFGQIPRKRLANDKPARTSVPRRGN